MYLYFKAWVEGDFIVAAHSDCSVWFHYRYHRCAPRWVFNILQVSFNFHPFRASCSFGLRVKGTIPDLQNVGLAEGFSCRYALMFLSLPSLAWTQCLHTGSRSAVILSFLALGQHSSRLQWVSCANLLRKTLESNCVQTRLGISLLSCMVECQGFLSSTHFDLHSGLTCQFYQLSCCWS